MRERKGNVIAFKDKIEPPVTKSPVYNFIPIVVCPYCKKKNRAAVSGWGGIISKRWTSCKQCGETFYFKITTKPIISEE